MSLIPEFEIGLWNGWIFILFYILVSLILPLSISKKTAKKMLTMFPMDKTEKKIFYCLNLAYYLSLIYALFIPLKLNTIWFYIGVPICLLGIVIHAIALINFASTPLDILVTKGIYRISRNPLHFSYFIICIGIGITCASWIFLVYSIVYIILQDILHSAEERFCLEKYGDAYREYMKRTPRYIGVPGR
jgi:protein-S-isoprenylcysteine O-methyltransferase Ste14